MTCKKDSINSEERLVFEKASIGETIVHEVLSHGMGLTARPVSKYTVGNQDPVQMSNLYRRSQGISLYRDGTFHDRTMSKADSTGVPLIYQLPNAIIRTAQQQIKNTLW